MLLNARPQAGTALSLLGWTCSTRQGCRGSCVDRLPLSQTRSWVLQADGGHDPEKELQRQLASKLGLKKGKTKMGGDDGLDEFLEGAPGRAAREGDGGMTAQRRACSVGVCLQVAVLGWCRGLLASWPAEQPASAVAGKASSA